MIKCKLCNKSFSPNVYPLHIQRCKLKQVEETIEEKNEEKADYNDLTVSELKSLADEKGIEYPNKINKSSLIELLGNK